MKFNLFLLLLITLIATVLGQPIPLQQFIRSAKFRHLFWAVDETGTGVVLKEAGDLWVIVPGPEGSVIRSVEHGGTVTCNGIGKQLTIEGGIDDGKSNLWDVITIGEEERLTAFRSHLNYLFPLFAEIGDDLKVVCGNREEPFQWEIQDLVN